MTFGAAAYGGGLGLLTAPVLVVLLVLADEWSWHWTSLGVVLLGSVGMGLGGVLACRMTRACHPAALRIVVMALIASGLAFPIAALPFIVVVFVGFPLAWFFGAALLGFFAFVLALLWAVFLCIWRRSIASQAADGPPAPRAGLGSVRVALALVLGIATQVVAIGHLADSNFIDDLIGKRGGRGFGGGPPSPPPPR
jgi:hypothetical protein